MPAMTIDPPHLNSEERAEASFESFCFQTFLNEHLLSKKIALEQGAEHTAWRA